MDCSKTEVFFAEWHRMCDAFPVGEGDSCPMKKKGATLFCSDCRCKVYMKTGKAIEVVQEWSDTHPIKTRLSVLKEHYPNARMAPNGAPHACVKNLYNIECPYKGKDINDEVCLQCWNTPIEDGE